MEEYIKENLWSAVNCYSGYLDDYLVGRIVGLGAVILNGFSYENIWGNLTYLCDCKELDGLYNGIFKLIYIPDYREPNYGFNNSIASPERTICDFLMYPEELDVNLWIYDILENYLENDETPDDWSKVYEMLDHFGISHELFEERLKDLEEMED